MNTSYNDFDISAVDMREIEAEAHKLRAEAARDLVFGLGRLIAKPFHMKARKKTVAA